LRKLPSRVLTLIDLADAIASIISKRLIPLVDAMAVLECDGNAVNGGCNIGLISA
jgi:hypothetical protein